MRVFSDLVLSAAAPEQIKIRLEERVDLLMDLVDRSVGCALVEASAVVDAEQLERPLFKHGGERLVVHDRVVANCHEEIRGILARVLGGVG